MTRDVFVMRMRKAGASSWGRGKVESKGSIRLYDQYDRLVKQWKFANIYYFNYRFRLVEKSYKSIHGYYILVSPELEVISEIADLQPVP
jgi:hypothetical protein